VTEQERSYALQGRNEVKWHPGQEASLALPCLNPRSFGSKFTVLKNVHVALLGLSGASHIHLATTTVIWRPGNCAPLFPSCHVPDAIARRPGPSHAIGNGRSVRTAASQARRY